MRYLTTHDLVWINSTVTGESNAFDFVTLEGAMASQYRYGDSTDVPGQAAEFLAYQLTHPAFSAGVRATAFIATLAFLNANGYATIAAEDQAAKIVVAVASAATTAEKAIAVLAAPAKEALSDRVSLRQIITHECNLHQEALRQLADGAALSAA